MNNNAYIYLSVLAAYVLILVMGSSIWSAKKTKSLEDFTTGGGIYEGIAIGLVTFATRLSSSSFIGAAAIAYRYGWVGIYYWGWIILAALLVTIYLWPPLRKMAINLEAETPMEVVGKRFESKAIYIAYSLLVFVGLTLMLIAQFKATGLLLTQILGTPLWVGAVVGSGIMLLYSIMGGRHADIFTDVVQGILMITIVILAVPTVFKLTGGPASISAALEQQDPLLLATTRPPDYSVWVLAAMPFYWLFTYGTQPYSIHLAFTLKSQKEIRRTLVLEYLGYAVTIIWCIAMGLGGRILFPGVQPDAVVPTAMMKLFSPWIGAIFLAAMWSAIMSSADGILLTGASAIANDIYLGIIVPARGEDPNSDQIKKKSTFLARLTMTIMVIVALIITLAKMPPLLSFIQYLAFAAVGSASVGLLVGTLFWKRTTVPGVIVSMISGLLIFIFSKFFIIDPGSFLTGVLGGIGSLVTMFIVSLFTKPPEPELIEKAFREIKFE
jgi:SSS family transporter